MGEGRQYSMPAKPKAWFKFNIQLSSVGITISGGAGSVLPAAKQPIFSRQER
jgi:hypothetical protein